jgi:hypothetical protein
MEKTVLPGVKFKTDGKFKILTLCTLSVAKPFITSVMKTLCKTLGLITQSAA